MEIWLRVSGVIVTGLLIWWGFYLLGRKADRGLSDEARRRAADSLTGAEDDGAGGAWTAQFADVFDRVFGDNPLSWRCFRRSYIASLFAVVVLFLVWVTVSYDHMAQIFGQTWSEVTGVLIAPLLLNALPAWLSVVGTRAIVRLMVRHRNWVLALLLADVLVTVAIFWICFVSQFGLFSGLFSDDWLFGWWLMKRKFLATFAFSLISGNGYFSVLFYATFAVTFWLWLYAIAFRLIPVLRRVGPIASLLRAFLPSRDRPEQSIGIVSGWIGCVSYWVFGLMSLFVACGLFAAACGYGVSDSSDFVMDRATRCKIVKTGLTGNVRVSWSGPCVAGLAQGNGVLQWYQDGARSERYEGPLVVGKRHGKGTQILANGNRYMGSFFNGHAQGKGVLTGTSGDIYEGEFALGMLHGAGKFTWANGNRYQGGFKQGKQHGKGEFFWANGNRYVGEFAEGKQHGKGIFIAKDGTYYNGEYVAGLPHGFGIFIWSNGDRYDGDFMKGKKHGKGKFVFANGDRFEGDLADDVVHGQGVFVSVNGNRYEGQFVKGNFDGQGVMKYANGDQYVGGYLENQPDGQGILTFANGRKAVGLWRQGCLRLGDELFAIDRDDATCP